MTPDFVFKVIAKNSLIKKKEKKRLIVGHDFFKGDTFAARRSGQGLIFTHSRYSKGASSNPDSAILLSFVHFLSF